MKAKRTNPPAPRATLWQTIARLLQRLGAGLFAGGLLILSSPVSAQDKPAKGVITLAEVTIVGRIQKPIASVDVNRIQPKLTLQELRQPFLDKIEQVLYSDPF
jgi:hypothetical protein